MLSIFLTTFSTYTLLVAVFSRHAWFRSNQKNEYTKIKMSKSLIENQQMRPCGWQWINGISVYNRVSGDSNLVGGRKKRAPTKSSMDHMDWHLHVYMSCGKEMFVGIFLSWIKWVPNGRNDNVSSSRISADLIQIISNVPWAIGENKWESTVTYLHVQFRIRNVEYVNFRRFSTRSQLESDQMLWKWVQNYKNECREKGRGVNGPPWLWD